MMHLKVCLSEDGAQSESQGGVQYGEVLFFQGLSWFPPPGLSQLASLSSLAFVLGRLRWHGQIQHSISIGGTNGAVPFLQV